MSSSEIITGTLPSAGRLDKALAEATGLSRARVQALIAEGAAQIAGKIVSSASTKVAQGAAFRLEVPSAVEPEAKPQDIPLTIAFEDEHLVVVNKPAGMVVHPAAGNPDGTLVNALLHHCAQNGGGQLSGIGGVARPGIVHRIDKDTSGLLVVAKSDAAHEGLAAQFAEHSVHRRYLAITGGVPSPSEGTIDERIGRSDANRKKMAVLPKNSSRGKNAVTHDKVLNRFGPKGSLDAALIECRLETGRTHQVRVHCASIGHALLGDQAYGRTPKPLKPLLNRLAFARQALHAAELGFVHPISREFVSFSSELPSDMQELIDELGRSYR
ncbi:MAG: RluA family pseudouridine synthase [Pseudomonadota bacterium]